MCACLTCIWSQLNVMYNVFISRKVFRCSANSGRGCKGERQQENELIQHVRFVLSINARRMAFMLCIYTSYHCPPRSRPACHTRPNTSRLPSPLHYMFRHKIILCNRIKNDFDLLELSRKLAVSYNIVCVCVCVCGPE